MVPLPIVAAACRSALADVPPPFPFANATYVADIRGTEAAPDHQFLVYPWSDSNGRPMASLRLLEGDAPITFGRRILGAPRLYAVPRADLDAWFTGRPFPGPDELDPTFVAFLDEKGSLCAELRPVDTRLACQPAHRREVVEVEVRDGVCHASEGGGCGCAAVGAGAPAAALLGATLTRRRRAPPRPE